MNQINPSRESRASRPVVRSLSDIDRSTAERSATICVVLGPKKSSTYSSEYASGFSRPAALHLAAPLSPRHERQRRAGSRRDKCMIVARTIREYLLQRPVISSAGAYYSVFLGRRIQRKAWRFLPRVRGWGRSAGGKYDSIDHTEYRRKESGQVSGIGLWECHPRREHLSGFLRVDS